jgi:hypothetical protein
VDVNSELNWREIAQQRWRRATVYPSRPNSAGPYAVLQYCHQLTVALCSSLEEGLDVYRSSCCGGGMCYWKHSLTRLDYDANTGKLRVRFLAKSEGFKPRRRARG